MQEPGDQTWNGGTDFKWGAGTTAPTTTPPLAGDGRLYKKANTGKMNPIQY